LMVACVGAALNLIDGQQDCRAVYPRGPRWLI
jgi:hypothetical protein